MQINTETYGNINIIEDTFWGTTDKGDKITTICSMLQECGEYLVDIYVNDEQVASNVALSDVGNELDFLGHVKL